MDGTDRTVDEENRQWVPVLDTKGKSYYVVNDAPIASNEIDNGIVWIDSEITEESFGDFHQKLNWAMGKAKTINVCIASPGGHVFYGLGIYDLIRSWAKKSGKPINTIGYGHIASAASYIFQAGTKRIIAPTSFYLIHQARTSGLDLTTFEMEDEVNLLKRIQSKLINIYCERSKLTPEAVKIGWERKDWWLDAAQVMEFGLADEIL